MEGIYRELWTHFPEILKLHFYRAIRLVEVLWIWLMLPELHLLNVELGFTILVRYKGCEELGSLTF